MIIVKKSVKKLLYSVEQFFIYCRHIFFACVSVGPSCLQLNIHGGCSLQNSSKRFQDVVSEVPGPGAYNVLPALGNMLRAATADAGKAEKRGRKMVGTWMKR